MAQAGADLGVAQTTFGNWLNSRSTPPRTKIPLLAEKLGIPVETLQAVIAADRARRLGLSAPSPAPEQGTDVQQPAPVGEGG